MGERGHGRYRPTLQLQRELTGSGDTDASLDAIPVDWSVPEHGVVSIRVTTPFTGTVPAADLPDAIRALTRSRRADLAGVAWTCLALAPQGCAAVVVPASFLAEATQGHVRLRRQLTTQGRVHGIVRLAVGVYKPRSSAAVLVLGAPDTGPVWFCDVVDPADMPQPTPTAQVSAVGTRWRQRHVADIDPPRSGTSFFVSRDEIAAAQFEWSLECYRRDAAPTSTPLRSPHEILTELAGLEAQIFQGIRDLVGVLKR